jgi:hypothetical protein
MKESTSKQRRGVFCFRNPRTASNLLIRLLSKQDQFAQADYFFLDAKMAMASNMDSHPNGEIPQALRDQSRAELQEAFNKLQRSVRDAESQVCSTSF